MSNRDVVYTVPGNCTRSQLSSCTGPCTHHRCSEEIGNKLDNNVNRKRGNTCYVGMKVEQLLTLLPDTVLEELAVETKVNHYAKKLQGQVIFKLILHCLLTQKSCSLRGMENAYETLFFRLLSAGAHQNSIAISSISERLSTIRPEYFEKLYQTCVKGSKQQLGKGKEDLIRFDSTIVALSTRLLNIGYQLKGGDAENYRQLKFTVGYSNGIAETVQFFTDQSHNGCITNFRR